METTKPESNTVPPVAPVQSPHGSSLFIKYIAMALFVALPFLGFWLGMEYAEAPVVIMTEAPFVPVEEEKEAPQSQTQTYVNEVKKFTMQIPSDWTSPEQNVFVSPDFKIVSADQESKDAYPDSVIDDEIASGVRMTVLQMEASDYTEDLRNSEAYLDFHANFFKNLTSADPNGARRITVGGEGAVMGSYYLVGKGVGEGDLAGEFTEVSMWHNGMPIHIRFEHTGSIESKAVINALLQSLVFTE